ncbi:hypothetical protein ApDm4_1069 [Acetobacter pomorum]|nr:hypothetical protein ApDm4_1069 [Acetobacter pomorum]
MTKVNTSFQKLTKGKIRHRHKRIPTFLVIPPRDVTLPDRQSTRWCFPRVRYAPGLDRARPLWPFFCARTR